MLTALNPTTSNSEQLSLIDSVTFLIVVARGIRNVNWLLSFLAFLIVPPKMVKRRLIIDTDCGGDDAIGIMAALVARSDIEVVAITTVWGNVPVDQGMHNIGKLLDLFGRDIPIFRGAEGPLMGERETVSWMGYGEDGFGDADFPPTGRVARASKKHAALALVDILADAIPSDDVIYQIITLGPLTNVALAVRLEPKLFEKLGNETFPGLVVMGGAIEGKGNSNLVAEFNVHCDAEAARIVFLHRGLQCPFWLISWEVTTHCVLPWEWYDQWINRKRSSDGMKVSVHQNRIQTFIEKLFGKLEGFTRPRDDGSKIDTGDAESTQDVTCVVPDAVAVVAALDETLVLDAFDTFVTVELHGRETRGGICIDWYGTDQSMQKKGRWRNCRVITRCDQDVFLKHMQSVVDLGPE